MTFYKAPPTLTFGDKYEVLLKEISLGSTFPGVFKIKVENEDKDMNPVFRIEDSIFKGGSVESSLKKTSVYRKFEFLSLFVYLLKNGSSQFFCKLKSEELVFFSEELSCLPYKDQNSQFWTAPML